MSGLLGNGTMLSLGVSARMAPTSGEPGSSGTAAALAGRAVSALVAAHQRAAALVQAEAQQQAQSQQAQQQQQQQPQPQQGGQPPPMLVEPVAKEQMWLLSQAYASMTDGQKEKLAAQPPEVRSFVLQERMRKAREFEALVQAKRAATAAAGLLAQPVQQPAAEPWAGAAAAPPGAAGSGAGLGEQQQAALQQQLQQQQQQQQQQQEQHDQGVEWLPQVGVPQPTAAGPGLTGEVSPGRPAFGFTNSGSLQFRPSGGLEQQQGHADGMLGTSPQQLLAGGAAPLPPPPLPLGPAEPAVPPGGGAPLQPTAPFAAMAEADRMKSMHQIRKRQQEWLEQQRRAAALLAGPSSEGAGSVP
jgi:hypothetical protein